MSEQQDKQVVFGSKGNTFVTCETGECKLFRSVEEVQEAYRKEENKGIKKVRVMSSNKESKGDWEVDLTAKGVIFEKTPFGSLVLRVSSKAIKPYKEEHAALEKQTKNRVIS